MKSVHNMEPQMRHYVCVVHLLISAGQLEKALRFIAKMPVTTDLVAYRDRADLACRGGRQEAKCWMLSNTYARA
jgi:hypothetical protein